MSKNIFTPHRDEPLELHVRANSICELREIHRDIRGLFLGDTVFKATSGQRLKGTGRKIKVRKSRHSDQEVEMAEILHLEGIRVGADPSVLVIISDKSSQS